LFVSSELTNKTNQVILAVSLGFWVLPHLSGVEVKQVEVGVDSVVVDVVPKVAGGLCPRCAAPARRVHSRYVRRLADVAVGGRKVLIKVTVRRFFCASDLCKARTFVEQIDGLISSKAPRSYVEIAQAHTPTACAPERPRPSRSPTGSTWRDVSLTSF
jgi:transposase